MTKNELLKELSATLFKAKVQKLADLAQSDDLSVAHLVELSFYPQKEIAFRASWVLEHLELNAVDKFLPHLENFIQRYLEQENKSCQRHFTKIMMRITDKKAPDLYKLKLKDYDFEAAVNTTFEWLIHPKTPIAVRVNCMEILFNLHLKFDWIRDELEQQIVFSLRGGGPAVQSRGKKLLALMVNC
jgi:hypothetical protein